MKIKDFATMTGLSESAIRYYERVGVLHSVGRLTNGYREFDDKDVQWIEFVTRLRNTGMPISGIVEFSRLRALGNSTLLARKKILEDHERRIVHEIDEKTGNLKKLREKIALYGNS